MDRKAVKFDGIKRASLNSINGDELGGV